MDNFGYRTYGVTDEEASKLRGMGWEWSQRLLRFKSPTNKVLDMGDTFKIIRNTEESDMSSKVAHAMTAITKQYAPDEDFAWAWIRKANEMGWVWGAHAHKVGSLAPTPVIGFSNGDGVSLASRSSRAKSGGRGSPAKSGDRGEGTCACPDPGSPRDADRRDSGV
jgi:hypothetical protein